MAQVYKRIKPNWLFLGLLAGALLLHVTLRIKLMQQGFVSVAADEFARGIRNSIWASAPSVTLHQFTAPWLPLEMYINGLLMHLWSNPFWVPRITVFAASCLTLLSFVWLNFLLFESRLSALINAYFLVLFHWFAWLSATPMLEMYYLPFYILGLAFLVCLIKEQGNYAWFWGGMSMLLASSIHVQSWLIIATTLLCTLPFSLSVLYKKNWKLGRKWFGFYLISVSFVAFALFAQWSEEGVILGFLNQHTTYSLWYYNGYKVTLLEKLLYYPRIVFSQTPQMILLLLILAIWSLLQEKSTRLRFAPLLLSGIILMVFSYSNLNSGPPSAAPDRYSLFYNAIFIMYAAYGFKQFITVPIAGKSINQLGIIALAMIVLVVLGKQQYTHIFDFPHGMSAESVLAGSTMRDILASDDANSKIMLELSYWEFLAVEMMINSAENIVYDRERIMTQRNLPSILTELTAPQDYLIENHIHYLILRSPKLIAHIESATDTTLRWQGAEWKIYSVNYK